MVQGPVGPPTLFRLQEEVRPNTVGGAGNSRCTGWSSRWVQALQVRHWLRLGPTSSPFLKGPLSVQVSHRLHQLLPGGGTGRSRQEGGLHLERRGERPYGRLFIGPPVPQLGRYLSTVFIKVIQQFVLK